MPSQFIDLEAQVDSDEEFSEDEDERQDLIKFLDDSPINESSINKGAPSSSTLPLSSTLSRRAHIDDVVERIEDQYLNQQFNSQLTAVQDNNNNDPVCLQYLSLRTNDWRLWRVKCTPKEEYFVLSELLLKHDMLSDELRAAFYNPRDIGYLYLEAQFSKHGLRSLREIMRAFSDIRMSSLTIVPESEIWKYLTVTTTSRDQVMVPGQWVQIKRGLYTGDTGVIANQEAGSVEVLVVPRLSFGSILSSTAKRKRIDSRPPPQLFDPRKCKPRQILQEEKDKPIYTYRSYRFEYGLQVKHYNPSSLSPAREISPHICALFMQLKELAGAQFNLFDLSSIPLPSFWHFEPGERVLVHHNDGIEKGIISSQEDRRTGPSFVVDFGDEGENLIKAADIVKDIALGDFVKVLAGIHAKKTGFVVAKADTLLGICVGQRTNSLDFRVHVNSVKVTEPDYLNTEMPWLDVGVKLSSAPHIGRTGLVKLL
ncbi:hypothetical protein GGU10DRAFT_380149 [Lentinula aff. detonsa]|uniref:NGN domain-containing protein n=1 Tax=Lentinula aff. detonsa TaxID=2804958 RepID=A0AA38KTQ0_9AGAR|nr:hypothetical protein GGU10DRAFT_380149 [Lentinula aff. detonsa]